jgi:ElaB/YqjD/DUF883 family membrane-anchored ribosome-binding protein
MADNANGQTPLTEKAAQKAKQQTHHVKEQAQQAVEQGQQAVGHVWELGRSQFHNMLTGQKERAATGLGDIAQMLHEVGSQLDEQGRSGGGQVADSMADRFSQLSETIHRKEIAEMIADTEDFARMRPAAFLSLAALVGFLLARFLKSSGTAASAA